MALVICSGTKLTGLEELFLFKFVQVYSKKEYSWLTLISNGLTSKNAMQMTELVGSNISLTEVLPPN
jgi:hypothetical protein